MSLLFIHMYTDTSQLLHGESKSEENFVFVPSKSEIKTKEFFLIFPTLSREFSVFFIWTSLRDVLERSAGMLGQYLSL